MLQSQNFQQASHEMLKQRTESLPNDIVVAI